VFLILAWACGGHATKTTGAHGTDDDTLADDDGAGPCGVHAICTDGVNPGACVSEGGGFQGLGLVCSQVTCGACCQDAYCYDDMSNDQCVVVAGAYWPGKTCDEVVCDDDGSPA